MDSHTLAMNRVLGLAMRRGGGWPTTLHDHGYRVIAIEADVRVGKRRVSPDIVLLNEGTGHMLAIDCKGGANVDPDQDGRYSRMALGDLVEATRPPCAVGAHTVAYAIGEGSEARVGAHTGLALVVFGRDSVRGVGDLGHDGLTACLREGVRLGGADVPEEDIYPFSVHDSDDDIDYKVAGAVMAYMSARPEMAMGHLVNLEVARGVLAGDAYTVRTRYGRVREMTRDMVRRGLDSDLPGGLGTLYRAPSHALMGVDDFLDACRHFGLDHLLFDITYAEAGAELEARRARGAPPTARELPLMMGEEEREYADAMLDVYGRKAAVAEARAMAVLEAAMRAA